MISFPARIRLMKSVFMNFPFSVLIRFPHGNCPTDLGPATCHLSFLQFFVPQSVGFSLNQSTDEKIHVNIQTTELIYI